MWKKKKELWSCTNLSLVPVMIQMSGMSLEPFPPVFSPYKGGASEVCLCISIPTEPQNRCSRGVCTIFIRKPFTDGFLKDQSIKSSTYLLTLPQLYFWNKSNNPSKEPGNSAGWAPTRPSLDQFGGNTTEHLPQEVFFPKGWIPAVSPQEKLH